jgi:hypothetical protein
MNIPVRGVVILLTLWVVVILVLKFSHATYYPSVLPNFTPASNFSWNIT